MNRTLDSTQALGLSAEGRTAADDLVQRLEQLHAIGASLSAERDIHRLLEAILTASKSITRADGGTLYRVTDENTLRFEIVRTSSLRYYLGGTSGNPVPFYPIQLYKDGRPNHSMVAAHAALTGKTVSIADAYTADGFDFSGTRAFDSKTGYRSKSFLTVPMRNHEHETIGVLQLINAQDPRSGEIVAFSPSDQRLAESLASQAAIALSNRMLINQLEQLFESFINLINSAIDEKSPYTGGHCQRVPQLTMMLAEAVNETREGPLSDFNMTEKDRYELKIAGLLHDCGKVNTPVRVVDKATKLETIYDRIHLIDTRFEVLRRDLELQSLKNQITEKELRTRLRELEDDRRFLHACNIGGERMRDEDIQRVRRIAGYRWRDLTGHEANFLSDDEVTNLTIRAGTLTEDGYHIDVPRAVDLIEQVSPRLLVLGKSLFLFPEPLSELFDLLLGSPGPLVGLPGLVLAAAGRCGSADALRGSDGRAQAAPAGLGQEQPRCGGPRPLCVLDQVLPAGQTRR